MVSSRPSASEGELSPPRPMKAMEWISGHWRTLVEIEGSPRAVAVGVAAGIFFGFTPLVGLKTLLALGVTRLFRGNLLAAAITVTLHDVLLPIAPLLLRWEYDLGYLLLNHPHNLPPHLHLRHQSPSALLHWSTFITVGRPLLIGSLVFAAPLATASYYLTLSLLARARRRAAAPESPLNSVRAE